ncbi:MAG: glycerate kinase [Holophagaceae bacterium]|nr:glycerate kinase [Holophagaceae bacterium]
MNLIAPTAFKGTLSPLKVAQLLADDGDRVLPMSDGGDGFIECLHCGLGGKIIELTASDPYGRNRSVSVLQLPDGTMAVESALVIGMAGLEKLDPLIAESRGLGELLAQLQSAPRLLIGLGGSATVDGGMGWPSLDLPPTTVFCDVRTDLKDAVAKFAPQKGATTRDLPVLQKRLMGLNLPTGHHTGSAGGLGAKLKSLGAELVDGGTAMMELLDFDKACMPCDVVITGEGRLDRTSLEGKLPIIVAKRARHLGKTVIGHFGSKGKGWEDAMSFFDEVRFENN